MLWKYQTSYRIFNACITERIILVCVFLWKFFPCVQLFLVAVHIMISCFINNTKRSIGAKNEPVRWMKTSLFSVINIMECTSIVKIVRNSYRLQIYILKLIKIRCEILYWVSREQVWLSSMKKQEGGTLKYNFNHFMVNIWYLMEFSRLEKEKLFIIFLSYDYYRYNAKHSKQLRHRSNRL